MPIHRRSSGSPLVMAIGITLAGAAMHPADSPAQTAGPRTVMINRARLPDDTLRLLEQTFQTTIPDGRYWYDAMSGAWGQEGGPTIGFTYPGLPIGGPLPADISGGGTGVFINGRELHQMDVLGLQQLVGAIMPGRYFLDAQGNAGYEGGPPIANLRMLAAQAQGMYQQGSGVGENYGGGAGAYGNLNTGIGIITDGEGGAAVFSH